MPVVPSASPSLSPGGNAAGLFPTLDPKTATAAPRSAGKDRTRPMANTSALPEGTPVAGAQLAGLAALALAFVLAVTRLSVRRRSSSAKDPQQPKSAGGSAAGGSDTPEAGAGPGD